MQLAGLFGLIGLGLLYLGLERRALRQRLRDGGITVEAVRTGRQSSGEGGSASEVQFTTPDGETRTTWVADRTEDGYVVYDPEWRGPWFLRRRAVSPSSLESTLDNVGDWLLIIVGLIVIAGVLVGAAVSFVT